MGMRSSMAAGVVLVAAVVCGRPVVAGETMPPGPPWRTDFPAARREALRRGVPLFVYYTKTY
jgi:hypothetical protein